MNKTHHLWCLVLLFAFASFPVWARPPFGYDAALRWADETVKTDIPKAERIYILGPDKVTETYLLDNKPTLHDVEIKRAIHWEPTSTLASVLLKVVPLDNAKELGVCVYRAGTEPDKPVFSVTIHDLSRLVIVPMQARDVVLIEYVPKDARPVPVQ